ncbi:hypothetical protein Hypma_005464 [Hypsizygus marmoreus]|uniref:Secreted protein n=1 Tax=Hypsizygus marmoreus TaxID=39966 RepID=A0A369J0W8_HYPMA|nr:hypothetical protein Hypma_005464 [Hypsizygus marmoreus]
MFSFTTLLALHHVAATLAAFQNLSSHSHRLREWKKIVLVADTNTGVCASLSPISPATERHPNNLSLRNSRRTFPPTATMEREGDSPYGGLLSSLTPRPRP